MSATSSDVALKPRGPQLVGSISEGYAMACNLWWAAQDHKKHCEMDCNVSIGRLRDAANRLVNYWPGIDYPSQREKNDFSAWEWPL